MCWHFDDVVQEQVQSRITQAYNVGSKVIWRMEPVNINSELLHKLWQKNLGQLLLLCVIHIWPWPKGYTLRLFYCSCFTFSICYCSIFSVDDALSKMSVKVDWNPFGVFFWHVTFIHDVNYFPRSRSAYKKVISFKTNSTWPFSTHFERWPFPSRYDRVVPNWNTCQPFFEIFSQHFVWIYFIFLKACFTLSYIRFSFKTWKNC